MDAMTKIRHHILGTARMYASNKEDGETLVMPVDFDKWERLADINHWLNNHLMPQSWALGLRSHCSIAVLTIEFPCKGLND